MDPSESVKCIQLFAFLTLLNIMEKALAHINGDVTSRTFPFILGRPKQGKEGGCDWSALVSFGGQSNREAVARMSGRHQMISLRNLIS